MPHNLEAEQGLLASCMLDAEEVVTRCLEAKLPAEAFYDTNHQLIFESLTKLYEKGSAVDEILLAEDLSNRGVLDAIGGIPALHAIGDRIETAAHAAYFLDIVRSKYLLRRLIRTGTHTVERCFDEQENLPQFLQEVEQEIFAIGMERSEDSSKAMPETIDAAVQMVQTMLQNKGQLTGLSTGLTDLDKLTRGLHKNAMVVLAARPSMGKTSLALNILESIAAPVKGDPVPTLMFSLEMGYSELGMRLLCARARVSMSRLADGFRSQEESQALANAAVELKKAPIIIDDSSTLTILELRARARRIASRVQAQTGQKLGFIAVDYLQLLNGTNPNTPREQQISEISRGMKGLAKELEVPVLVLSQLNRDSEKEKRKPRLSDLRESGSIEQDADMVFLLSKPRDGDDDTQVAGNVADLIVAKQRNGPVGEVRLSFRKEYTRFENYTSQDTHESGY